MKRKLIDHLVTSGLVERNAIQRCVLRAKMDQRSVVREIVSRLDIEQDSLAGAMADFWGMDVVNGSIPEIDGERLEALGEKRARECGVLPIYGEDRENAHLVVYDVEYAKPVVEEMRKAGGISPTLSLATPEKVDQWLERYFQGEKPTRESMEAPKTRLAEVNPADLEGGEQPTRQVDLDRDNPFMALVAESADDQDARETHEQLPEPSSDFFGESPPEIEEVVEPEEPIEPQDAPYDQALEEFDEQLGEEISEIPEMETQSSVNWGEHKAKSNPFGRRPPTAEAVQPDEEAHPQSGLFRVQGGRSGTFNWPDESSEGELTLAEMVDEQRKQIKKLEREVDYQKGVMQTMAELLVEARVISGKKLKKRLREFRRKQRNKYD